jgi:hypothetical protein
MLTDGLRALAWETRTAHAMLCWHLGRSGSLRQTGRVQPAST